MNKRSLTWLVTLGLLAVPASAHPGDHASAPCPGRETLYLHGHATGTRQYEWLDTRTTAPGHADDLPVAADADGRLRVPLLPNPTTSVYFEDGAAELTLLGSASTSYYVLPPHVRDAITAVIEHPETPPELDGPLSEVRDARRVNQGAGNISLNVTIWQGHVLLGQADVVADVVHAVPGQPGTFQATTQIPLGAAELEPRNGTIVLQFQRDETRFWSLDQSREPADDVQVGTRIRLPVVDGPNGALCPDVPWRPVEITIDVDEEMTVERGARQWFDVVFRNPERADQEANVSALVTPTGVTAFSQGHAFDTNFTVPARSEERVRVVLGAAADAQLASSDIEVEAAASQASKTTTFTLHVVEPEPPPPEPEPQPSPSPSASPEPSPAADPTPTAAPQANETGSPEEAAQEEGGRSPSLAVGGVLVALAAALSRRR